MAPYQPPSSLSFLPWHRRSFVTWHLSSPPASFPSWHIFKISTLIMRNGLLHHERPRSFMFKHLRPCSFLLLELCSPRTQLFRSDLPRGLLRIFQTPNQISLPSISLPWPSQRKFCMPLEGPSAPTALLFDSCHRTGIYLFISITLLLDHVLLQRKSLRLIHFCICSAVPYRTTMSGGSVPR